MKNQICIVSVEQLPNEGMESLWLCVEVCEIKNITSDSEPNVNADIPVLKCVW